MIRVTCAIIRNEDEEVLVVQRGEKTDHPFKWEFPGGKVIEGETDEECIIREIKEELSMDIVICGRFPDVEYDYGKKQILLIPFSCDTLDELPVLSEHVGYLWVSAVRLKDIDFSEADKIVAENYVRDLFLTERSFNNKKDVDNEPVNDDELKSMVTSLMGMKNVEWIASSAIDNPAVFRKLVEYSYSDDKNLAFRASWILTKACARYPEMITPFINEMIERLEKIDNESVERAFLRIISLSEINKLSSKHQGILADHCFAVLRSGSSAIAIKAYSMEAIYKLALVYPELASELSVVINLLQEDGSAGILARGRMILKKLAGFSGDDRNR